MNKVPDLERERALNASINDAFFCLEPETCAVDWAGPVEYEGAMQCPSCGDSFDWSAKFAEIVTCRSCQAVSRIGDGTPSLAGQSAKLIASSSGLGMGVTEASKGSPLPPSDGCATDTLKGSGTSGVYRLQKMSWFGSPRTMGTSPIQNRSRFAKRSP